MEDITERYRTKCPPKEHEEAVRMLLDGINQQSSPPAKMITANSHHLRPARPAATFAKTNGAKDIPHNNNNHINSFTNYDQQSIASHSTSVSEEFSEDASSSNLGASPGEIVERRRAAATSAKMQSKSTSTSDSVSLSSGIDPRAADIQSSSSKSSAADDVSDEAIPSRTIAVQCDLKLSSAKNSDGTFDGAMQVSSISSTRYGFYKLSPETLEARRRLKRSMSSRNVAPTQTSATLNRPRSTNNQVEAPTSMSELSSSSPSLDGGRDYQAQRCDLEGGMFPTRERSSSRGLNSRASDDERDPRRPTASQKHGLKIDRSNSRVAALDRRPKTALSYVSSSRLRDGRSLEREESSDVSSDHRDGRFDSVAMKTRAVSHQTLPRTRQQAYESSISDLDCTSGDDVDYRRRSSEKYQVPCHEEIEVECAKCASPPGPRIGTSNRHGSNLYQSRPSSRRDEGAMSNAEAVQAVSKRRSKPDVSDQRRPLRRLQDDSGIRADNPMMVNDAASSILNAGDDESIRVLHLRDLEGDRPSVASTVQRHQSMSCDPSRDQYQQRYSNNLNNPNESTTLKPSHIKPSDCHRPYGESRTLTRTDRFSNKTVSQDESELYQPRLSATLRPVSGHEVSRSTSMRHMSKISRPNSRYLQQQQDSSCPMPSSRRVGRDNSSRANSSEIYTNQTYSSQRPATIVNDAVDDGESLTFKTWANPSVEYQSRIANGHSVKSAADSHDSQVASHSRSNQHHHHHHNHHNNDRSSPQSGQRPVRSYSMKDVHQSVNNATDVRYDQQHQQRQSYRSLARNSAPRTSDDYYNSSSESSLMDRPNARGHVNQQKFVDSRQLDYDSQHRLNEIGLPDANSVDSSDRLVSSHQGRSVNSGAASFLGVPSDGLRRSNDMLSRHNTAGRSRQNRPVQVSGRAMSQQSLTQPAMPLTRGRRRVSGSNSGSEVGGSSMSLVSRLTGRYENAHTRSPVVLYIPQAAPRSTSTSDCDVGVSKLSSSRKSTRSIRNRKMSSSQDRLRRSSSRNNSDSETSSMMRTLVKPRGGISRRSSRMNLGGSAHGEFDDGEDMDGVGQLASEMDGYKFKRRYSVPKNAKINWFAKLKSRVSSKM